MTMYDHIQKALVTLVLHWQFFFRHEHFLFWPKKLGARARFHQVGMALAGPAHCCGCVALVLATAAGLGDGVDLRHGGCASI